MVCYCAIMEAYNPTFLDTESNSFAAKYEEKCLTSYNLGVWRLWSSVSTINLLTPFSSRGEFIPSVIITSPSLFIHFISFVMSSMNCFYWSCFFIPFFFNILCCSIYATLLMSSVCVILYELIMVFFNPYFPVIHRYVHLLSPCGLFLLSMILPVVFHSIVIVISPGWNIDALGLAVDVIFTFVCLNLFCRCMFAFLFSAFDHTTFLSAHDIMSMFRSYMSFICLGSLSSLLFSIH